VTVAHRRALRLVLPFRPDDLVDLLFHQLGENADADADAQRKQPLLRRAHEVAERLLHARRQHQLAGADLLQRYGLHGGSSCLDRRFRTRHGRHATGRGGWTATSSSTSYGTTSGAAEIRAEGARVIAERPWPAGWEGWRPPPEWAPLALPEDWHVV